MSTLVRPALMALVLASGVLASSGSATMAQPARDPNWTDLSKPHGGYPPNSPQGNRAFWDYQNRQHE